ncbi:MAG: nucleotidyl transferase AbiEii/AbiGii toxin family protein [Gemmatimonadota bacterium]|nr:nucleotidyl transferase AbiEii/AbiGii toxin family protein [Gemmatimonadota bacterium]
MPLTDFQRELLAVTARNRAPDSYLAGGTALHFSPESVRYSRDLDLFHDAEERVAEAFAADVASLEESGYEVEMILSQPGFIRALVSRGEEATQIDWADSAWRFMPVMADELGGYVLHPIDLATNKVLALAGRDEPRDFVDMLFALDTILPLGPLVWAAVAKDPGYNPMSLLEQLRRRGRVRPEEVARLDLSRPFDVEEAKTRWREALEDAERFVERRPPGEVGALYWSAKMGRFVAPEPDVPLDAQGLAIHYGRMGGVLPRPTAQRLDID